MAAKQIELAQSIQAALAKRFATVSGGFDSSGNPTIQVGAGTIGSQSAFLRVKAVDPIGTDSLGLTQRSFGPHVVQVVLETSSVANVALLLESAKLPLLAEVCARGTRVELYMSANGNAADVTDITSGNLKIVWNGPLIEFGLMAAV